MRKFQKWKLKTTFSDSNFKYWIIKMILQNVVLINWFQNITYAIWQSFNHQHFSFHFSISSEENWPVNWQVKFRCRGSIDISMKRPGDKFSHREVMAREVSRTPRAIKDKTRVIDSPGWERRYSYTRLIASDDVTTSNNPSHPKMRKSSEPSSGRETMSGSAVMNGLCCLSPGKF